MSESGRFLPHGTALECPERNNGSVIQWKNCHVENNIINRTAPTRADNPSPHQPMIGCTFVE